MALDEYRNHGVNPLTADDVMGSGGYDGKPVHLPTSTYENPGPTTNIRGIEPNTNWATGTMPIDPVSDTVEGYTRDAPFNAPQDALGDVDGDAPDGWQTQARGEGQLIPEWPQVGSFSKFGEHYPANGDQDGDGDSGADTDHDGM